MKHIMPQTRQLPAMALVDPSDDTKNQLLGMFSAPFEVLSIAGIFLRALNMKTPTIDI